MSMRLFLLWLLLIPGLGMRGRYHIWQYLMKHPDTPLPLPLAEILQLGGVKRPQWDKIRTSLNDESTWQQCLHTPFVTLADAAYPTLLRQIDLPPVVLFFQGDLTLANTYTIGIVGSRHPSLYGTQILRDWIPGIAQAGLTTVSGLAAGVDGMVHAQTLLHHGKTIAVIGNGLQRVYPSSHQQLQPQVGQHGLILSEYLPMDGPQRWHFPERNRIIAGLSRQVLIIEARERSGSLITGMLALDANREVLAVPGRINDENSAGCNALIVAGAQPVTSVADVLTNYLNSYWLL